MLLTQLYLSGHAKWKQKNIYKDALYMLPTAKEIFSRTKYTRFKSNKSRYVWKSISYLFNVW